MRVKFILGVEDNVKLDLWSRQMMPSQSTERKKSWYLHTRLVHDRCCALVNYFLNRAIVTTCPGLPYVSPSISEEIFYLSRFRDIA